MSDMNYYFKLVKEFSSNSRQSEFDNASTEDKILFKNERGFNALRAAISTNDIKAIEEMLPLLSENELRKQLSEEPSTNLAPFFVFGDDGKPIQLNKEIHNELEKPLLSCILSKNNNQLFNIFISKLSDGSAEKNFLIFALNALKMLGDLFREHLRNQLLNTGLSFFICATHALEVEQLLELHDITHGFLVRHFYDDKCEKIAADPVTKTILAAKIDKNGLFLFSEKSCKKPHATQSVNNSGPDDAAELCTYREPRFKATLLPL